MRSTTRSNGTLVVTNFDWSWLVICLALEANAAWIAIRSYPLLHIPAVAAMAAFGLVFVIPIETSHFEFDPASRMVSWRRRTLFTKADGVIPFDAITSIALGSAGSMGQRAGSNARRLTLHTDAGVVPITSSSTAFRKPLRRAAAAIQSILRPDGADPPPIIE